MTFRTFLAATKRFRKATAALKPGARRATQAKGARMRAYDEAAAELDAAIIGVTRDIRDIERLKAELDAGKVAVARDAHEIEKLRAVAGRAAELLLSIRSYEERMAGSNARCRWNWPSQAEKVAQDLRAAVQATRDPDRVRGTLPEASPAKAAGTP